jgi:hypothetical protein
LSKSFVDVLLAGRLGFQVLGGFVGDFGLERAVLYFFTLEDFLKSFLLLFALLPLLLHNIDAGDRLGLRLGMILALEAEIVRLDFLEHSGAGFLVDLNAFGRNFGFKRKTLSGSVVLSIRLPLNLLSVDQFLDPNR